MILFACRIFNRSEATSEKRKKGRGYRKQIKKLAKEIIMLKRSIAQVNQFSSVNELKREKKDRLLRL